MKEKFLESIKKTRNYVVAKIKSNRVAIIVVILLSIGFISDKNRTKRIADERNVGDTVPKESIFIDMTLYSKNLKEKREYLLDNFDNDFVIGDKKAPLTIVDFSSFSCSFCRQMRRDINKIVDEYAVKSKRLRYVLRPVVNSKTIALKILLGCVEDSDKRWKLIDSIFSIDWMKINSVKTAVDGLMTKHNIDAEKIRDCLNDDEKYQKIVYYQRENSQIFKIEKTPLLVVNGRTYSGYKNYDELKKIIDENVHKN
jgi:protein-disulfide isomerase